MVCFGEYEKKYHRSGMICLPAKWIKVGNKAFYCTLCKDKVHQVEYLRFFYSQKDLAVFAMKASQDTDYEILQCSRHRIFQIGKMIMLPKEFLEKGIGCQHKNLICLGVGNGFEVWYTTDYHKMQNELDEELLDILSDINLV